MNKEVMEEEGDSWKRGMRKEMKKVRRIAAPMVVASVLQYLLPVVSLIMVGHLNQLSLSSVAIATSLTNVSGFSVLVTTFSVSSSTFTLSLHQAF
ncbi:Protein DETOXIFICATION 7 [Vigna angularis]|uniref:Protein DETOXIFICATION 7 n=1 Tax=Phaseolus angularis TaxID=3914 RepID=A0A8T0KU55_PHAAN|nr:Protein DETOXIFICATION 7 [Vigna angularis]